MTSLPEGEAPKNSRASVTQFIYFLVLLTAVAYLVFIYVKRYWYFEEFGHIEVEKTVISSSQGGRIESLPVNEGQKLFAKDRIAIIEALRDNCDPREDERINKLRFDIDSNISKRNILTARIKTSEEALTGYELRRALELDRGLSRDVERKRRERDTIKADRALLDKQIVIQKKRLTDLQAKQKKASLPEGCYNEQISSPFNAIVASVLKRPKEFAQRGEAIITLMKETAPVRIEVYLDQDVLKYLHTGDRVDLVLPDGTDDEAVIEAIHSSAYAEPNRQWHNYKPADTDIRVHLRPADASSRKKWLPFDRMEVRVRGFK